ncbi:MAG: DUF4190 domain-containing protein [Candidatus Dormibacteria bacterium]
MAAPSRSRRPPRSTEAEPGAFAGRPRRGSRCARRGRHRIPPAHVRALIFGGIALNQIEATGERGRSMARAAIILGVAGLAVGVVAFIVVAAILASATPTIQGPVFYPG